jgi:leucyl-tRNA synthetase
MEDRYTPQTVEAKWQKRWEETGLYRTELHPGRTKFYFLTMFPYPSADLLHLGHWYVMTGSDVGARFKRMQGYDVLFPIGFDAFGLPAENAAIRHGIHPRIYTSNNITQMRSQIRLMGCMFDWSHEVVTCDPEYYRWNQWFFLQFFHCGLAYRKFSPVDWCPTCNTTLAREQVVGADRLCERCDTPVTKRDLNQWFFKTTEYAEELLDFAGLDWPERTIVQQRNWIGKSVGVEFTWQVDGSGDSFRVFTTRPDTVFGATFCVLAPEHPLVERITTLEQRDEVEAYIEQAKRQTEIDRLSTERERTGVWTGAYAINPMNGQPVPIYIADYVLMSYGTGAIMAVPAHDERDFDFATRHGLPIPVVIAPPGWDGQPLSEAYTGEGTMVNSRNYDDLPSSEAWGQIADEMEARGIGERRTNYRLRDWLISRQRYWGTPIPIVYCDACGIVPVPEDQLPVLLPEDVDFRPTGESPLRFHEGFLRTQCPRCGGPAERETDTMDTFVDSSWYQYRYLSPHDDQHPFDPEKGREWLPVDQYTGGPEHAVMHLLYTRFWTKAMRDLGLVGFDEPIRRLYHQGIILGPDGMRMSKSRGNVVLPDSLVQDYGADAFRTFLLFIGPWDQGGPWNPKGSEGVVRFLNRVWTVLTTDLTPGPSPSTADGEGRAVRLPPPPSMVDGERSKSGLTPGLSSAGARGGFDAAGERALRRITHQTIRKVGEDLGGFAYNTAVAALMELVNALMRVRERGAAGSPAWNEAIEALVLMLAPMAPHLSEELWERLGRPYSVHQQPWPQWDPDLAAEETVEIVIQVNGKLRDRLLLPVGLDEEELRRHALASGKVQAAVGAREPRKVIVVPNKLVNVVA